MDAFEILMTRRSIRKFKDEPVSDEDIHRMIDAARMAPSATNIQNWQFIVVKDQEVQKEMNEAVQAAIDEALENPELEKFHSSISKLQRFFTFFDQAPVIVCALHRPQHFLIARTEMARGKDTYEAVNNDGYSSPAGVAAAIENLLLAAHALGYGTCWMSGPLFGKERIEDLIGVEDPFELMALIPLGVPAESPEAPKRKPVEEIMTVIE